MSDRAADSTIKGFLYQFNKTILSIVGAEDDEIVAVEGLVEDVDVHSSDGSLKAIQCKYHESRKKFTDSLIYKPILQMAESFSKNSVKLVEYVIFIYVPGEGERIENITRATLDSALATEDKKLQKIVGRIDPSFNHNDFLTNIKIAFGPSLDDIEDQVKLALNDLEINSSDVDTILYPNAITKIAKISSCADEKDRQLTKENLCDYLSNVTTTAVTKWTLALKNRSQLLDTIKNQLSGALSQNSRERYFYFSKSDIDEFDENIVVFIHDYIRKYHYKPAHLQTPVFAISSGFDAVKDIEHRLFKKGVKTNTGLIGDCFEVEYFYREPIKKISKGVVEEREFDLRLLALGSEPEAINYRKGDDLYLICNSVPEEINTRDVNQYQICTCDFNELSYVIGLRGSHE